MTWEDLVALQKKVEVGKPEPLQLKEWAEGWLWAIQTLRGEGFYEQGKGALTTHPFRDAPDWFNEGIHKMLGSQARQAWIYVAFHTGISNHQLERTFGKLNDTNWRHNYDAQLDFFAIVMEPEKFCGVYRKVQGDNPGEEYVRLMIKACAARVLSRDTQMDETLRRVLQDDATSEAPPIPKSNKSADVVMQNTLYYPLFKEDVVTPPPSQPRPRLSTQPTQPPQPPPPPPSGPPETPPPPSSGRGPRLPQVSQSPPVIHDADAGVYPPDVGGPAEDMMDWGPKQPDEEYEESPSYGVLIGAIVVIGIAVYSQM